MAGYSRNKQILLKLGAIEYNKPITCVIIYPTEDANRKEKITFEGSLRDNCMPLRDNDLIDFKKICVPLPLL